MKNEEKWTESATGVFMNILTFNSIVIVVVMFGKSIIKLIFSIFNKINLLKMLSEK